MIVIVRTLPTASPLRRCSAPTGRTDPCRAAASLLYRVPLRYTVGYLFRSRRHVRHADRIRQRKRCHVSPARARPLRRFALLLPALVLATLAGVACGDAGAPTGAPSAAATDPAPFASHSPTPPSVAPSARPPAAPSTKPPGAAFNVKTYGVIADGVIDDRAAVDAVGNDAVGLDVE